MIEFIPYILPVSVSLVIGLVSMLLYSRERKFGLALISVGFFLSAIPGIVSIALGGPYFTLRLTDRGYTLAEIGAIHSYLFLFGGAIEIIFAVLVLTGLVKVSRQ